MFDQIKNKIPAEKLEMEEFSCLSELGKFTKDRDADFQEKIADFFWDIIVSKGSRNLELLDSCVQKYREMVKHWTLEKKMAMFVKLLESLRDRETPSIPCIKLFKGLISDQNEYTSYSPQTTGTYPSQSGSGYQTAGSG